MQYLKIWVSFAEIIEPLNDGERGRLFTAMLEYAERGTLPEFKGNERYIWPMAKQAIDRTRDESGRRSASGAQGGRPRKEPEEEKATESNVKQEKANESKTQQAEPTESHKEKEKEKEKEKGKETPLTGSKEKPAARFFPPSLEEVRAYCQERQNGVSPERFVDFYASKGWKVGNQPMKDWRACVRTWENRDNVTPLPRGKTVSAQDYTQRAYTEADLNAVSGDLMAEARAREAMSG